MSTSEFDIHIDTSWVLNYASLKTDVFLLKESDEIDNKNCYITKLPYSILFKNAVSVMKHNFNRVMSAM